MHFIFFGISIFPKRILAHAVENTLRVLQLRRKRLGMIRIIKEIQDFFAVIVDTAFADDGVFFAALRNARFFCQGAQKSAQYFSGKIAADINSRTITVMVSRDGAVLIPNGVLITGQKFRAFCLQEFHVIANSGRRVGRCFLIGIRRRLKEVLRFRNGIGKRDMAEFHIHGNRGKGVRHAEYIRHAIRQVVRINFQGRIGDIRLKRGNQMTALFHIGPQCLLHIFGHTVKSGRHNHLVLTELVNIILAQNVAFNIFLIESIIHPADDVVVRQLIINRKPRKPLERLMGEQHGNFCFLLQILQPVADTRKVSADGGNLAINGIFF